MHEYDFGFSLPKGYQVFLDDLGDQPGYDIGETGICLYAKEDLTERNQTYQIDEDEPDFFMMGIWPISSKRMGTIAFMKMI